MLSSWLLASAGVLFVGGLILLWQGWQGTLVLSGPHCRKCGYDLRGLDWAAAIRACPECGNDLNDARAVHFGKCRWRPRRMVLGGIVLCVGLALPSGFRTAVQVIMELRLAGTESNGAILANIARNANDAANWRKLDYRYTTRKLSNSEALAAIDHLIAYAKTRSSQGGDPLPMWSQDFLRKTLAGGMVSGEQLGRLCNAFYGVSPAVTMPPRIRQGNAPRLRVDIRQSAGRDLPGTQLIMALREVTIDGQPVEFVSDGVTGRFGGSRIGDISARIKTVVGLGRHKVELRFDRGLLDERTRIEPRDLMESGASRGRSRPPMPPSMSSPPPSMSPPSAPTDPFALALNKQSVTSTMNLEIVPPGEEIVRLAVDPKLDPTGCLSIRRIDVLPEREGRVRLRARCYGKEPPVPVMFQVSAEIEGQRFSLGRCGGVRAFGVEAIRSATGLSPSARTAKVTFEPDVTAAEDGMQADQIWGKPIVFENVPLERYDVDAEETAAGGK